jgi:hypothetical protein
LKRLQSINFIDAPGVGNPDNQLETHIYNAIDQLNETVSIDSTSTKVTSGGNADSKATSTSTSLSSASSSSSTMRSYPPVPSLSSTSSSWAHHRYYFNWCIPKNIASHFVSLYVE